MNEHGFWDKVRGILKDPPQSDANHLSAETIAGTPDCLWAIRGKMGLLELKFNRSWPVRDDTLVDVAVTVEQRRYLERIAATGNRAQVLLGVEDEWFLLEMHEVPPAPDPKKPPKISRLALAGVRRAGRAGSIDKKGLTKLRDLLASSTDPVDG
jgi:hypothetical protein